MPVPHLPAAATTSIVELDPRAQITTQSEWRYTARPRWSSAGESLWMRLSKFSFCNRMGVAELNRLFSRQDGPGILAPADLRSMGRWDPGTLTAVLEIEFCDICAAFCSTKPRAILTRAATELRYCPVCLETGFHAAWFQWQYIERCPLHRKPLRTGCPSCAAPIPYVLGANLALSPLHCVSCQSDWVPSLARPAGRCVPLTDRAAVLNGQVGRICGRRRRCRRPSRSRLAHRSLCRRPTSFNSIAELASSRADDGQPPLRGPPPPIGYWTSALPPRHVLADADALAVLRTAEHHKIGFDPLEWPHFAGTFTWYERIVRAAQAHLFAPAKDEFEPGRWRKLLVDDLVMSADTAPHDVAAALGWTVSWLGPSQALAPATGFTAPASGLTAWLTRIPLRPPNVSPQRWQARVSNWLLNDLAVSAQLWSAVAKYMSAQHVYLLYGDAVSPVALALRRSAVVD